MRLMIPLFFNYCIHQNDVIKDIDIAVSADIGIFRFRKACVFSAHKVAPQKYHIFRVYLTVSVYIARFRFAGYVFLYYPVSTSCHLSSGIGYFASHSRRRRAMANISLSMGLSASHGRDEWPPLPLAVILK